MIYFLSDDHYNARPGANLYNQLHTHYPIRFQENDTTLLTDPDFLPTCSLLILNMIAGTGTTPPPSYLAEQALQTYVHSSKPLLLLHGSSAAFWPWKWWRELVGFRWVRGNDPDGIAPSTHPVAPYHVELAKARHPLVSSLIPMQLPRDEIYINLEQTQPAMILMQSTIDQHTHPQCYECRTPGQGKLIGFLPGHDPQVIAHPDLLANVRTLIDYLRS